MKKLILFLLLPIMIKAQYINSFEGYNFEYTPNRLEYFPIGNIGFNTKLNPYNPNMIEDTATIFANVSAYTNLSQTYYASDEKRLIEDRKIIPNFIIQYQHNWFAIQASYVTGLFSSVEGINKNWYFNFYPPLTTDVLFIPARNSTFQLSSIFKLSDGLNASLGLITNNFETQLIFPDQGYIKYKSNLFDKSQFYIALNCRYDDIINCYLLFRSASHATVLKIEHSLVANSHPSLDYPHVFFNGIVGAGIKVKVLENLCLSVESKNDLINYQSGADNYSWYPVAKKDESQFNARVLAGINYKPSDFAQVGILYSRYFSYKNPFSHSMATEIAVPPYAVILGASVSYNTLNFNFQYQYSGFKTTAKVVDYPSNYEYSERYNSQYIGFGIDVGI